MEALGGISHTWPDVGNKGWQHSQKEVKTKHYSLQKTVPDPRNSGIGIDEHYLKYEFAKMFAEEFIKDKIISIRDQRSHMRPGEIMYQAEMTVAPPGISTLVQPDKTFMAYNQRWTEQDIFDALKNTFPERLL